MSCVVYKAVLIDIWLAQLRFCLEVCAWLYNQIDATNTDLAILISSPLYHDS